MPRQYTERSLALLTLCCALLFASALAACTASTPEVTECDRLAAYGWDEESVAPIVADSDLNLEAAEAACRAALRNDPDNPRLKVILARVTGNAGDRDEAIGLLESAVQQDYPAALAVLGSLVIEADFDRGITLIERAAARGHARAQGLLALLLNDQRRPIYDPKAAFKWAEMAAAQGDRNGQYILGAMLLVGAYPDVAAGVERDEDRGVTMLELAGAQGHAAANWLLGTYYEGDGRYQKARLHHRAAVEAGFWLANVNLAALLMEGLGGPVDEAEAIRLYCAAGDYGVETAQDDYGLTLEC